MHGRSGQGTGTTALQHPAARYLGWKDPMEPQLPASGLRLWWHGDHALVRAAPGQFLRQLPAHFSHAGQGIAVLGKGAPCGQAFGQRRGIHFKQQGRLGRRRLPGLDRPFMLASYSPRRCKKSPSAPRLILFPPAFHAHPHAPLSSHTKITGGLGIAARSRLCPHRPSILKGWAHFSLIPRPAKGSHDAYEHEHDRHSSA